MFQDSNIIIHRAFLHLQYFMSFKLTKEVVTDQTDAICCIIVFLFSEFSSRNIFPSLSLSQSDFRLDYNVGNGAANFTIFDVYGTSFMLA